MRVQAFLRLDPVDDTFVIQNDLLEDRIELFDLGDFVSASQKRKGK